MWGHSKDLEFFDKGLKFASQALIVFFQSTQLLGYNTIQLKQIFRDEKTYLGP